MTLREQHSSNAQNIMLFTLEKHARRAGSDGSMSASDSAVQGSILGGVVNFHLKIFNLGARRGGDVHFPIARLYITGLD